MLKFELSEKRTLIRDMARSFAYEELASDNGGVATVIRDT
jgi:hypothetical protein